MKQPKKIFIRHTDLFPDGTIKRVHPWKPANTLLKQFAQMLYAHMAQSAQSIKATDNSANNFSARAGAFNFTAAAGETSQSIQVGTGTTAVLKADYKIETLKTSNFVYSVASFELLNPTTEDWHILIHRAFTNNTGASFDIHEVALVCFDIYGWYFCLDRTLYDLTFANGESRIITYKIQI